MIPTIKSLKKKQNPKFPIPTKREKAIPVPLIKLVDRSLFTPKEAKEKKSVYHVIAIKHEKAPFFIVIISYHSPWKSNFK